MTVTVFQSAAATRPAWVDLTLASVRDWALGHGFTYRFLGDELFDSIEPDLARKLSGRGPVLADIARLDLLSHHLERHGGVAIWIDADTLCLDRSWLPDLDVVAGFGEECWIQLDDRGGWRAFSTPHNAFMVFGAESPVLPFLRHVARSMIERVDPRHIAPQMIGPKLLKALHNLASFHLYPQAGALSPALIAELAGNPGAAVQLFKTHTRSSPAMMNLCQSLVGDEQMINQVHKLCQHPESFAVLEPIATRR